MKITLSAENFNALMKATKNFVSKSDSRPIFTQIKLCCKDDGLLTATALDGHKCISITVKANTDSDSGEMIIPWVKPIDKQNVFAEISNTEKEITIRTASGSQSFRQVVGKYLDTSKLFSNAKVEAAYCFNPKLLAKTFSAFDTEAVKIECLEGLRGFTVSSKNDKKEQTALVLPLNPKGMNF